MQFCFGLKWALGGSFRLYLSMKNSKLESVDEHGQDSMSSNIYQENHEFEDFDDFYLYLFIKTLADLSSVVPILRPLLLPKQTRSCLPTTLVLDLDGKKIGYYVNLKLLAELGWLFRCGDVSVLLLMFSPTVI